MPVHFKTFAAVAALAVSMLALAPHAAKAHATLEIQEAKVNTTYRAVMRVPHGCDGEATLRLRIRIPEGMISVRPMPKAGWTLEIVKGPLDKPYSSHGREISEGVKELIWSGELDPEHYDEFIFRGRLTSDLPVGETVYVPTVQECANGAERWIEIPAQGQSSRDLKYPAPGLRLLPAGN
jgi:uncharacterized protein YcnI